MKKIVVYTLIVAALVGCTNFQKPVGTHNGKDVYVMYFPSALSDPNQPSLDVIYDRINSTKPGWKFHDCANGMKEVRRIKYQEYIFPTASTKRLVWFHEIRYYCK